jgi:hypothetical protein
LVLLDLQARLDPSAPPVQLDLPDLLVQLDLPGQPDLRERKVQPGRPDPKALLVLRVLQALRAHRGRREHKDQLAHRDLLVVEAASSATSVALNWAQPTCDTATWLVST